MIRSIQVHDPKDRAGLDELPHAYHESDQGMRDQMNVVEVVYECKQVCGVQGGCAMENGEATLRQQIIALLRVRPWEAGGLARALGISQRQVESHLTHVSQSVEAHGERMVRGPAQCRDGGFASAERTRTTKPSRCPQCKSAQLAPPVFEIR